MPTGLYQTPRDRLLRGSRLYCSRPSRRTIPWNGLTVSVEFDVGDVNSGIDERGRAWVKRYDVPYGEINGTRTQSDGDPVDVYLGDYPQATMVYVCHQTKADGTTYDEPKCMLDFPDAESAVRAYKRHGPKDRLARVDAMTVDQFKNGFLKASPRI